MKALPSRTIWNPERCWRPLRSGNPCRLHKDHHGRCHGTDVFICGLCEKVRRSSQMAAGPDPVFGSSAICWFCVWGPRAYVPVAERVLRALAGRRW